MPRTITSPKTVTLPNGARIIHACAPAFRTTAIVAGIHVGSRHEPTKHLGMSHFLEHMLFKGSELFKTTKALSKAIDDKGGYINATTDKEVTSIQIRVASEFECHGAEVAMELLCKSRLRASDMAKEKPVVQDEIRMYEADDRSRVSEMNDQLIFGKDPLGAPVAGSVKSVQSITPKILRDFYQENYVPSRISVAMTGNYTTASVAIVEKYLRSLDQFRSGPPRAPVSLAPLPTRPTSLVAKSITPRVFVRISFVGPSARNKEEVAALNLVSLALGGYSSARLYMILREKHSLCYSVGAYLQEYSDATVMTVYMEMEPKNIPKAISLLGVELRMAAARGITKEELSVAKSHYVGSQSLANDSVLNLAGKLVYQSHLEGEVESPLAAIARHEGVSLDSARNAAKKYLRNAQTTILVPDTKTMPSVRRFLSAHVESIGVGR